MPRGPSQPRFNDPALVEAFRVGLQRYKEGENPQRKLLKNKDLAALFRVSEPWISQLLKANGEASGGRKPQDLSAQLLARALEAGVSVDYDHVHLCAHKLDTFQTDSDQLRQAEPKQISFLFEPGFFCEETGSGLAISRKGPSFSSGITVHVKVG